MDSEEEVQYIEEQLEDCTQRFYVGGTITFATHPDQDELITAIDVEGNSITTIKAGETEWDISRSDLRVKSIPHDVLDSTTDKIAPFTISDYYGVEHGAQYWTYHEAYDAAEMSALDNSQDMYVHNVFGNECGVPAEYIEEDEEEEDDEEEADITPL